MCLLAGQGSIIGALLCSSNFLHPRHYTVSCRTLSFSHFQPSMSIPVVPPEHVQLFKGKYSKKKMAHRALLSADLNMHPNRQFPGLFVVHMPSCLHVLLCVTRPLCSLGGGGIPSLWVCSPGGVGVPSHAGGYYSRGVLHCSQQVRRDERHGCPGASAILILYRQRQVSFCLSWSKK